MFSPIGPDVASDAAAASPSCIHRAAAYVRPDAAGVSSLDDTGEEFAAGDVAAAEIHVRRYSGEHGSLIRGRTSVVTVSAGAPPKPGAAAAHSCIAAPAAPTFSTAAVRASAAGRISAEEVEEDETARPSPVLMFASQQQREGLNCFQQQSAQLLSSETKNEQQQGEAEKNTDFHRVTLQGYINNEEWRHRRPQEQNALSGNHIYTDATLVEQQATARGARSFVSEEGARPDEEAFVATPAREMISTDAAKSQVLPEATSYVTAAHPANSAVANASPTGHKATAAAAHEETAITAAMTVPKSTTAPRGTERVAQGEPGIPAAGTAGAGGVVEGRGVVDMLQQQAQRMLAILRSDTQGCTYSEAKRLDASLAQLQPEAEAIRNLVEDLRRMHRHTQELKAKTENNLLLIDRLKEEDKAFDEELDVLPEKLQSLVDYKATGNDELQALRTEYKLVTDQGKHSLQAWEKKLEIYQHALGLRINQSEQGGPTLVEFVDLLPGLIEDEQRLLKPQIRFEQPQQQQDERLDQVVEKLMQRKCCCFSFRLADGGRLAATMRRQFKRLLQQQQQQHRRQQVLREQQQHRQRWQRQQHRQQESLHRPQTNAAAEAPVVASPAKGGAPTVANFPTSSSAPQHQHDERALFPTRQQIHLQLRKTTIQEQTQPRQQFQQLSREDKRLQQVAQHPQPCKQHLRGHQQEQQHPTLIRQLQQEQRHGELRSSVYTPIKTRTAATAASSWSVERQRSISCNRGDFATATGVSRLLH